MSKELMPLENVNAVAIFQEGGLDELLLAIHAEAESHVPDLTTDKGRKQIASIAAKVAKSKTYLDGLGKDMVAVWKNQAKVVDADRRKLREDLDELKANVRKPLTEYEDAENARINAITEAVTEIARIATDVKAEWLQYSLDEIKAQFTLVRQIYKNTSFDERDDYAKEVFESAKDKLISAMDQREKYDGEQVELERLRTEAADRDAETNKKAADQKIKDDQKKAADFAVEKEKQRVAAQKKIDDDAAAAREADTKHRRTINAKAVEALMKTGIDADAARKVVTAIAKHKVPNVTIAY